ncbi:hypothetical protein Rumeso_04841 [Rubellimicrobium mesophilum DSM 19309]|uniref:DUF4139 domain-containing protein n=1 Tax=Rubellimicrobium mesophilum DSM 19309 TaxID=442562 RepID=A0A017HCW3_9RHOB|nr:DUF4139 domain-containing protein [Rubellimicrobium mesophilum]EYD72135.1 hypothetical protein Rumeso_04841 [Rubellimicrobium mesophilum DSM 19309]
MSAFRSAISIVALIAAVPALAQDAPVRQVTLFEAGLAELTRETGAARAVTLRVPLRDVNDVLKSLLVRGTGVTGASMALDGETPVEDAFASLPFPPAAATDLSLLLRSVPGIRVRIADRGYPDGREGVVMGVADDCATETGCRTMLTLVGDDGTVRRIELTPDVEITILDAEIAQALARGLSALREAASGTMREVAVTLDGQEIADGAVTYVVAAPAWKTSYRALTEADGAVDLQAWAVIENATGEDWDDVSLTLSSGSPRTLTADLHGRDWRYRPEVQPEPGMPMPVTVMEPEAPRSILEEAVGGFAGDMAAAAPPPAPIEASAATEEGVLDSRFQFAAPVDLAAGEMLSLPFLADSLEASHLSLWQGQLYTRTGNPDMVLEIVNDLGVRLPAGIMTVSDEDGGYVGDADFPLVGPGERKAVPYGTDRKLRVEETVSETTRQVSVKAAEGVLRITQEQVRDVGYLVTSPSGEAREVAVDHPQTQGWETEVVSGPQGEVRQEDDGSRWMRFEMPVAADGARLVLRDRYPFEQVVQIGMLDEVTVLGWVGQASDAASKAYLEEAARLMREASRAGDALAQAEAEEQRLTSEQERARRNLGSVENPSEAYDRFLAQLLQLEDRIGTAGEATAAARTASEQAQAALEAHLGGAG